MPSVKGTAKACWRLGIHGRIVKASETSTTQQGRRDIAEPVLRSSALHTVVRLGKTNAILLVLLPSMMTGLGRPTHTSGGLSMLSISASPPEVAPQLKKK